MAQTLLKDRFQLRSHIETLELPVYHLVVAKGGLKIKLSEDQTPSTPPQPQTGQRGLSVDASGKQSRGTFMLIPSPSGLIQSYTATPISTVIALMQNEADRLIVDRTNLKVLFDVQLLMPNDNAPPAIGGTAAAPPVPTGRPSGLPPMEEQWGLKLEQARSPVEVLVIDNVSKPSAN